MGRKLGLLSGSLLILSGLGLYKAPIATAQDAPATTSAPAPTPAPPSATPPPPADSGDIVITGSRIARPDYQFTNPVMSVDSKSIEYSGATNMTDFLQRIPALTGSSDSNDNTGSNAFIGGTGLNLLNLRNLGIDRTLVLVNGRRHVASVPGSAAIDTNTIPVDLVNRIDVLTGGASAIYGADGVSGVVNFIMKDDFQGFTTRAQVGASEAGGAGNQFISATAGTNFANNKGNVAVSLEYNHDDRLKSTQRDYTNHEVDIVTAAPSVIGPFHNVALGDLRFFQSGHGGAVDVDGDFNADFDGSTDAPWDNGNFPDSIQNFTYQQGGSGSPISNYFGDLLPEIRRTDFNLFGHYDFLPNVRMFTEFKYVNTRSDADSQPTFDFFLDIQPDNPFIPPNIAAANTLAGSPDLLVTRDNFDLGRRGEDIRRELYRGVVGFEGDISPHVKYNTSVTYGETNVVNYILNNRFNDRFAAALDVGINPSTLQPDCKVNYIPNYIPVNVAWEGFPAPTSFSPGECVPLNIFGDGSPSAAARNFVMTNSTAKSRITQTVLSGYLSGDLDKFFEPQGGSIGFAAGVEYRRETSNSTPAPEDEAGLTFGNAVEPVKGSFEVGEAYGELNVPIFKDKPFIKNLSVDAAWRISQYSTTGLTRTWKTGFEWAPVRDLTFRGTRARAVRAPNIGELFDPGGQDFQPLNDPCDSSALIFGSSFRTGNCATLLSGLGVANPAGFTDANIGVTVSGILKGNTDLQPEVAHTSTFGVVLRPHWLRGFTGSVDYYKIQLFNAIQTLDPEKIADECVDAPTLNNQFCALIVRENGGVDPGRIIGFTSEPKNVSSFTTAGYDISTSYSFQAGDVGLPDDWGSFALRLVGNHMHDLSFVELPGEAPEQDKGQKNEPEWQWNFDATWMKGPFTFNYNLNYFSRTQRFIDADRLADPLISDPKYFFYSHVLTHDIQGRYALNDKLAFYAGVNNLGDQKPDFDTSVAAYPVDPTGRFFYTGLRLSLGK